MLEKNKQTIVAQRINDLREYVSRSLHFVEAKNGSFLAFCSAIIAGILSIDADTCNIQELFLYSSLLPLFICIGMLTYSFFPKNKIKFKKSKKHKEKKQEEKGIHIFSAENISKMGMENLEIHILNGISDYTLDDFENQKVTGILREACAAARKYRIFRNALKVLVSFGIIFLVYILLKINERIY